MSANPKRQKLCWSCEGNVSLEAEDCPYCQADLMGLDQEPEHASLETYQSPYSQKKAVDKIPPPPLPFASSDLPDFKSGSLNEEDSQSIRPPQEAGKDLLQTVQVLTALMGGVIFFLFGWVLELFSNEGYLTLRWNSSYWFIYMGLGVLLLYFGFRGWRHLDSGEEDQEEE